MFGTRNNENCKNYGKLIESGFIMLFCLALLLYWAFSWFASNKGVTAIGMDIGVVGQSTFIITARADATEEALTVANVDPADASQRDRLFRLVANASETEISPGSSGSFSFWVSSTDSQSVNISHKVMPGGVVAVTDDGGNITGYENQTGYRQAALENEKLKAPDYLQGHILLFRNYTNEKYSGWLSPEGTTVLPLAHTDGTKNVFTIYWVWIDSYSRLNNTSFIDENDIAAITELNFTDGIISDKGFKYLFDTRENTASGVLSSKILSYFYDFADADIGLAISHIYFDLSFN